MNVHTCVALAAARPLSFEDARVAVFAWLLSRHAGGIFSLCLDVPNATSGLDRHLDALCWLGLDWDDCWTGDSKDPYSACVEQLLCVDKAYRRNGSQDRASSVCLRLAQDGLVAFDDLWLGFQEIPISEQADPLLLDAGKPTPILARVVGTRERGVTHVVRSPDRLSETALDLRLHYALRWDPPVYAHLPHLEGTIGQQPLSSYRGSVLGLALTNHLARLGWTPHGKRTLLSLPALARAFEANRVRRGPVSPDPEQLVWFNRQQLGRLDLGELAATLVPCWHAVYGIAHRAEGTGLSPQAWQQLLAEAILPEIRFLEDAAERACFAFVDELTVDQDARDVLAKTYAHEVLSAFADGIEQVAPYSFEAIDGLVSALRWQFKASHRVRSKDVMVVMRAALTGRVDGPCVVAACQLLGRARCIRRASEVML